MHPLSFMMPTVGQGIYCPSGLLHVQLSQKVRSLGEVQIDSTNVRTTPQKIYRCTLTAGRTLFAGAYPQINSCRTLCRQFQPFPLAQTNPTPGLTLTLILAPRGRKEKSRGPAACFDDVFPNLSRAVENPVSTNNTSSLQEGNCR